MKGQVIYKVLITCLLTLSTFLVLTECAARKPPIGDIDTGMRLQYQMLKNQELEYQLSNEIIQDMEVMGQEIQTHMNTVYGFLVTSNGLKENTHQLDFTINSMEMDIQSPQGDTSPDLSSIVGKGFTMSLSTLGKEVSILGADDITYDLGMAGRRSIVSDFQALFPDLSEKSVKVGDIWTTIDTVTIKSDNSVMYLIFNNTNTLDGMENIDGVNCAKVSVVVTGKLEGSGNQQGADLVFDGEVNATEIWYFAPEPGILVKQNSEGSVDGTVEVRGSQYMTIPLKMKTKMQTALIN